jgi:hypothetical protein
VIVMSKTFEIWETRSNNLVGAYATEDAALADVRAQLASHGKAAVETWTLLSESDDEAIEYIADSTGLAELAMKRAPSQAARA